MTLRYDRVEAVHADGHVTLDTVEREVVLDPETQETVVAQFQVPIGEVEQLRLFVTEAVLELADGTEAVLTDRNQLPSMHASGMKFTLDDPIEVVEDELIGMRGIFDFGAQVRHNNGRGYALDPTVPSEFLQINPTEDAEGGIYYDRVTVRIDPATPLAVAEATLEPFGLRFEDPPNLPYSGWARVKLPASVNLEQGIELLGTFPMVTHRLPAVDLAPQSLGDDYNLNGSQFAAVNAIAAANNLRGPYPSDPDDPDSPLRNQPVGSPEIRVAVIGSPVDLAHPDLYRRIWINPNEIPEVVWAGNRACDPSGPPCVQLLDAAPNPPGWEQHAPPFRQEMFITFDDLNHPLNWVDKPLAARNAPCAAGMPPEETAECTQDRLVCDFNCNGYIDAYDLDAPRDGEQPFIDTLDPEDNGYCDDLVGADMNTRSSEPCLPSSFVRPVPSDVTQHELQLATIIAAARSNDIGIGGVAGGEYQDLADPDAVLAGGVSIIPVTAQVLDNTNSRRKARYPDRQFYKALDYLKTVKPDVIVISYGWAISLQGQNQPCSLVADRRATSLKIPDRAWAGVLQTIEDEHAAQPALRNLDALVVVAAGNDALPISRMPRFPASDESLAAVSGAMMPGSLLQATSPDTTLIVGGIDESRRLWSPTTSDRVGSNYGPHVDVFAPAVGWTGVNSTYDPLPGTWCSTATEPECGGTRDKPASGTSLAAPLVGAIAALGFAHTDLETPASVRAAILETSVEETLTARCGSTTVSSIHDLEPALIPNGAQLLADHPEAP